MVAAIFGVIMIVMPMLVSVIVVVVTVAVIMVMVVPTVVMLMCVVVSVVMVSAAAIVVVPFTSGVFHPDGGQIEHAEDHQTDAGDQHHRPKDSVGRQVGVDASRGVEIEHHTAPEKQQGDTDQMNEGALNRHGRIRV